MPAMTVVFRFVDAPAAEDAHYREWPKHLLPRVGEQVQLLAFAGVVTSVVYKEAPWRTLRAIEVQVWVQRA